MPDWIALAQIEVKLHREFLASADMRPELEDAVWVTDAPCGPSRKGVRVLQEVQGHYGFGNVTTGNASPGARGDLCGIYVRRDVVEKAPNFLRSHLARKDP